VPEPVIAPAQVAATEPTIVPEPEPVAAIEPTIVPEPTQVNGLPGNDEPVDVIPGQTSD